MPSLALTVGSFLVAVMVGLTGMGGGALLTPMLMLVYGVPPLAAVSSDLVVSAVTRPVGALIHLRKQAVDLPLTLWLSIGSVPAAFGGGLIGWWLGPSGKVQDVTERVTGVVLVVAAAGVGYRALQALATPRDPAPKTGPAEPAATPTEVRRLPTLLIGVVVGLAVGVTSSGSGTLVIAALALLYPALPANRLVGTNVAQAVPMVLAAALAHVIAGDVQMTVTAPLLIGGIPGVTVGSLLASRVPGGLLRPFISMVVLASGLSLAGLSPIPLAVVLGCVLAACAGAVAVLRRRAVKPPQADTPPLTLNRPPAFKPPALAAERDYAPAQELD